MPSPPVWAARGGSGRRRFRKLVMIVAAVLALLLAIPVAGYLFFDTRLTRVPTLADYPGRPAASAGQNWLITGSDSRQGLSRQEEHQLSLGHTVSGMRSDTIMLLHLPGNGARPTLVSLPRDSYVSIPGHGMNKLNAAFSLGGPALLARTVQNATGLRISHYMGIGFGGLVRVVNAVGGVTGCVSHAIHDRASGLNLTQGCHTLSGGQALGYLRDRHSFSRGDLQREQDQRQFLRALLRKATSRSVIQNPVTDIRMAVDATGGLTVDEGTHLYDLAEVARSLGHPQTAIVPVTAGKTASAGDVLLWDQPGAHQLFTALAKDQSVPASRLGR